MPRGAGRLLRSGQLDQDNNGDVDLGSTVPLQLPNGRVFIVGKSGIGYLLNTASLGHIGGQMAINRVCSATNDAAFGSQAYGNGVVFVGCSDGLVAVQINAANTNFSILWHNTTDIVDKPPTFAGGLVWALGSSDLIAFNPSDGKKVMSFPISGINHFATPSAANNALCRDRHSSPRLPRKRMLRRGHDSPRG